MKRKIFSFVTLLLIAYILPAGVFSQTGSLVQNFTAKWVNKVPWLGYNNTPQAEFKTYTDTCSTLGCFVRILEQGDVPFVENYALFDWIADPQEILLVPDSVRITAKIVSKDPENLPIVRLNIKLLQKTESGGYFSGTQDISFTWNTYVWKITDTYRTVPSFEGFAVGVTVGQSSSAMKAVIAISKIELWKNGVCYYRYLFSRTTSVAVENNPTTPTGFSLSQNYPNPFNPSTKIRFSIPESGNYRLIVYNNIGQEISILTNGFLSPGVHEATFNATGLSSGVYFYRLIGKNTVLSKKMLLVK